MEHPTNAAVPTAEPIRCPVSGAPPTEAAMVTGTLRCGRTWGKGSCIPSVPRKLGTSVTPFGR